MVTNKPIQQHEMYWNKLAIERSKWCRGMPNTNNEVSGNWSGIQVASTACRLGYGDMVDGVSGAQNGACVPFWTRIRHHFKL